MSGNMIKQIVFYVYYKAIHFFTSLESPYCRQSCTSHSAIIALAQLDFSTNPNKLIFWRAEYESIKKSGI